MSEATGSSGKTRRGKGPRTGDAAVHRAVYDAILAHRLPPGTKLSEDSLGEAFGVSRTVVRKALFQLAHDGVVDIRPNRGAIVARPSVGEARGVFEARRVLERAVLERAVDRIGPGDLVDLRSLVDEEEAAHEGGDRGRWIRLSGDFHLRLADHAGNEVIAGILRELVSRTSLIIALYETPGTSACSADEHRAILDAIAGGDAARANALMDGHLAGCEDKLKLEPAAAPPDFAALFGRERKRA